MEKHMLGEKFVGSGPARPLLLQVYSGVISTADGLPFYIGWRWTNDDNTGSQFSFAIDNVVISATPQVSKRKHL
jgi:hypothetical protein